MRRCAERAAAAALLLAACSVASRETEVREALARLGRVEQGGEGAPVALAAVRFSDVAVARDGGRALVVAMVEAEGRVGTGGDVRLAYVGREAFAMERCAGARWCLAEGGLPALRGVVAALLAAPRAPGARVLAWQVRVERDAATAGEDYELDGRTLRARWDVVRGEAGWRAAAER